MYAKNIIKEYETKGFCQSFLQWRKENGYGAKYDLKLLSLFLDVNKSILTAQSLDNKKRNFNPKSYIHKLAKITLQEQGEASWQASFLFFMNLSVVWE